MKLNKEKRKVIVKKVVDQIVKQRENLLKSLDEDPKFIKHCEKNNKIKLINNLEKEVKFVETLNKKFIEANKDGDFHPYKSVPFNYNWFQPETILKTLVIKEKYKYLNIKKLDKSLVEEQIEDDLILNDSKDIEELITSLVEKYK